MRAKCGRAVWSSKTRVVFGTAASLILEVAAEQRANLIVVGTHGRKHGAHLFLGSVAESVVRSAAAPFWSPVLRRPRSTRWEGPAPLRLAVGTDGSAASQAALAWAGGLRAIASVRAVDRPSLLAAGGGRSGTASTTRGTGSAGTASCCRCWSAICVAMRRLRSG